jgi:protocatechuate 3,4-dioxygenase, beta subunit
MDRRQFTHLASWLTLAAAGCTRQGAAATGAPVRTDLYQCEGCEGALERPAATLTSVARIAAPEEPGEPFVMEGTVFAVDGATPAPGVVLYAYHTNAAGLYANGAPDTPWSRRHGRLRGWAKTDAEGRYAFHSIKPAPYPNQTLPAHVHFTVLEPDRRPYWIDDIVFESEFGVTAAYRSAREDRGGGGIVRLSRANGGVWRAQRHIILERHPT